MGAWKATDSAEEGRKLCGLAEEFRDVCMTLVLSTYCELTATRRGSFLIQEGMEKHKWPVPVAILPCENTSGHQRAPH